MGCNVNVDDDPKFKFVEFTLGFASVTFLFGDSIFKLCVLMEISLFFYGFVPFVSVVCLKLIFTEINLTCILGKCMNVMGKWEFAL